MTEEGLAGPLPEPVRQRVVTLASEGLGALPPDEVPLPLRPFARFAPSRRAKLAANPIAVTLDNDPAFRERVADRLRAGSPALATAIENGAPPPAADPLDVAAGAYLLRPPGWVRLVEYAAQAVERTVVVEEAGQARAAVRRLEEQLSAARASGRSEAGRLRAELDAARHEIQELRRELREAREQARQSDIVRDRASKTADELRTSSAREAAQVDAELRRLRSRLAETEATLEASRRAAREGRNMADVRVRLLLDTVLEAAQGLRRELALPPVP
ncbi:MAG: NYN domain-containing protein, partial [Carbonactinosporaceae bacterium]